VLDRLLNYVRHHRLMRPGDRVGVAVSGGADSVALLRLLLQARAELGIVLSVVHFNHRIRGADADADAQFVRSLSAGFDLEFHCDSDDTPAYARAHKLSLEAAARTLRYAFFDRLTADATVHRVATAHTRDDQAETVLMRFLRGSGTKGLAGIYPGVGGWISASVAGQSPDIPPAPRIVRPLLDVSRHELRAYLDQLGQAWREDRSNADVSFTRNRLRHEIMPALRQLNPALDETLSQMAEIARAEESLWNDQTSAAQQGLWMPRLNASPPGVFVPPRMLVGALLSQPLALQRRLIRMMVEGPEVHLEFRHVEAVRALAAAEPSRAERVLELPNGCEAVRRGQELWFRRRCPTTKAHAYTLGLSVPGEWRVAGRKIRASMTRDLTSRPQEGIYVRAVLLDPGLQNRGLYVRNWHAGDRYWPAHTRQPRKVKELLQARHIPRERKPFWPVIVSGDEIIWVPGFAAPERFRFREADSNALLLEEVPLGQSSGVEQ
jgi:tRNA(Ile)-lysidine synthase